MSPADVPDVTVVKAVAGWLGIDLHAVDPVAAAFAIRRHEDRMRSALAAVLPEIQAQAWVEGRDAGLDDLGATQTAIDFGELVNPYAARLTETTEETR